MREHICLKKLLKHKRLNFYDKSHLKNKQNKELLPEPNDPIKFSPQGLVNEDIPLNIEGDTNEEISLALNSVQEDEEFMDSKVITFEHKSMKQKNSKNSLAWNFCLASNEPNKWVLTGPKSFVVFAVLPLSSQTQLQA